MCAARAKGSSVHQYFVRELTGPLGLTGCGKDVLNFFSIAPKYTNDLFICFTCVLSECALADGMWDYVMKGDKLTNT